MKFLKLAFKGVLSVLLHLIGLSILLVITVALTNSGSIIGYVVFGLMVLGFISLLTDPSPKFPLRRFSIILCLVLMVPVGLSAIFLHVPDEEHRPVRSDVERRRYRVQADPL